MRKVGILLGVFIILGCFLGSIFYPGVNIHMTLEERVNQMLEEMTIEEKIGQMIFVSFRYPELNEVMRGNLTTVQPGGFILFKENVNTCQSTKDLIQEIQSFVDVPMFFGIDQEGGRVQRIKEMEDCNILTVPPMYDVGKTNRPELSYQVGTVLGEELKPFGINLDFAPSLDIFSNPENTVIGNRAFGTDADTVIRMGLPMMDGLQDAGMIPVVKHFPGHGDTTEDSHTTLPVVNKRKEELLANELKPFQAAIEKNVPMMMVAHIALPQLTNDLTPASLSKEIITNLLKEEMGYQGIVITDALDMKAITDQYGTEESVLMAIDAGVDILLMPPESREAQNAMMKAYQNKTLTEKRIDQSVSKILTLKYQMGFFDTTLLPDFTTIDTTRHQQILDQVKS